MRFRRVRVKSFLGGRYPEYLSVTEFFDTQLKLEQQVPDLRFVKRLFDKKGLTIVGDGIKWIGIEEVGDVRWFTDRSFERNGTLSQEEFETARIERS